MSVTSAEGVRVAQSLGASRVVLARELSLDEIARHPRRLTDCETRNLRSRRAVRVLFRPMLFFGSLGRAQRQSRPMRAGLPPALRNDGGRRSVQPLADARYLLSPGDLYALQQIPEIVAIGVSGVEDRGPVQGRGLRHAHHAGLSQGGG